jgi:mRNA interferase YafQ
LKKFGHSATCYIVSQKIGSINEWDIEKGLPENPLMSDWLGYQECHLKPNWLLIHKTSKNQINFARLGTHQQLFKKY